MQNKLVFVILAGGKSERMGVNKGLLKYNQTYWILEQLNRISKTNIKEIYIGLGFNFQHYFDAIPWLEKAQINPIEFQGLDLKVIINKNPKLGSFSTLQNVLKNISEDRDIIMNPIDIPILNSKELNKIISEQNNVVIPNFEGKNGHPIKLGIDFWKNLCSLDLNDKSSRLDVQIKKINPNKISIIEVSDRVITLNINTKKDWKSFLEKNKVYFIIQTNL